MPLKINVVYVRVLKCSTSFLKDLKPFIKYFFRLVHEVKNLQMTLAHLRSRLQEEQEALQRLVTTRANLEHEIRTKANSIFIDQEKCMGMRKTFPTTPRLSGYAY